MGLASLKSLGRLCASGLSLVVWYLALGSLRQGDSGLEVLRRSWLGRGGRGSRLVGFHMKCALAGGPLLSLGTG